MRRPGFEPESEPFYKTRKKRIAPIFAILARPYPNH